MKKLFSIKKFLPYIAYTLGYLMIWLAADHSNKTGSFHERFVNHVWLVIYLLFLNYILFEFTIPFIRLRLKRLIIAPFLIFAHLMLYSFGFYAWRHIGIGLGIYTPLKFHVSTMKAVEYHFPYSVFSVIAFAFFRHFHSHYKLRRSAKQLRIEKQEAELNYLKSQTNPHFLFNTLNNIYSLARDKSDLAPESILRLSKILRFMLYEAGGNYITLEKELKIILDYIELEKLRYDETLKVDLNYDVNITNLLIPPLLLIPLVENAFKHGVSETTDRPFISISLEVKDHELMFEVRNSSPEPGSDNPVKENIGLGNLRRQLELLYLDYDLTIGQKGNEFAALLRINLKTHV